jgi:type III secretory pathway lipoprotein EscJ
MRVEEMALRSEIRQMLNEAGFNRETIKQLVKESIDDVVKNQVNQVLMEKKDQDLSDVVSDYLDNSMYRQINEQVKKSTESIIKDKLRWLNFSVNVQTDRGVNK